MVADTRPGLEGARSTSHLCPSTCCYKGKGHYNHPEPNCFLSTQWKTIWR